MIVKRIDFTKRADKHGNESNQQQIDRRLGETWLWWPSNLFWPVIKLLLLIFIGKVYAAADSEPGDVPQRPHVKMYLHLQPKESAQADQIEYNHQIIACQYIQQHSAPSLFATWVIDCYSTGI